MSKIQSLGSPKTAALSAYACASFDVNASKAQPVWEKAPNTATTVSLSIDSAIPCLTEACRNLPWCWTLEVPPRYTPVATRAFIPGRVAAYGLRLG